MKLSVIIPVYCEEKIIGETADTLASFAEKHGSCEIIFVNDGSKDGSLSILRKKEAEHSCIRIVSYDENRGKGYAVRQGMLASSGDVAVFTDSDLAYGTDPILGMENRLSDGTGFGVVVGSRNLSRDGYGKYGLLRRIASRIYIRILSLFGGLHVSDSQCGIKGFTHESAVSVFSRAETDRFAFDFECLLIAEKLNIRIAEYPVKILRHNESKVRVFSDSIKMIKDIRKMKKRIKNNPDLF